MATEQAAAVVGSCVKLLDMREGYPFARNVLGFSDPSVAFVDGRWTMFLGGMAPTFRTNVYQFELPVDAGITSNQWRPSESAVVSRRRLRPIVSQPPRGSWNRCMHSVCYVRGSADGVEVERIYHAGRTAATVLNRSLPYRIGYLEKRPSAEWESISHPLPLHSPELPSVLEPKVEYHHGRWHMRYLSIPVGLPDGDTSQFRIMQTTSRNGRDDGSEPEEWFGAADGFFDSVVLWDDRRAMMVITRDSDLEGRDHGPPQGVWLSTAPEPQARRTAWSEPTRLFTAEDTEHEWTGNGMCAPSAHWANQRHDSLSVFFAGAPRERTWSRLAAEALRQRKLPPVPSPVYFTIGRLDIDVPLARRGSPGQPHRGFRM